MVTSREKEEAGVNRSTRLTDTKHYTQAQGTAQCYVAAWIGGEFGGEWIHIYIDGLSWWLRW